MLVLLLVCISKSQTCDFQILWEVHVKLSKFSYFFFFYISWGQKEVFVQRSVPSWKICSF